MEPILYVIYGNVSSGKTTLARALQESLGGDTVHLSSDGIRQELTGSPNGRSKQVFNVMRQRMLSVLNFRSVIIDSTGQSPQFAGIVNEGRLLADSYTIQLQCNKDEWKKRENQRDDRWDLTSSGSVATFEMPERAYEDSHRVLFDNDLYINTTSMPPEMVLETTLSYIKRYKPLKKATGNRGGLKEWPI